MSRFLDGEYQVYHQFQKIFNSFDIYMRRKCVDYFVAELDEGLSSVKYFNFNSDSSCVVSVPANLINTNYNNATSIALNENFFNMKYDKRFGNFMQKIIEKYDK
jgi:hypothetical protein